MDLKTFSNDLYKKEFVNYDVTNKYELMATVVLLSCDLVLYAWVFINFRSIFCGYYRGSLGSPFKMICINFNLLISILRKRISRF